ncbi:MAG: hypothetical protein SGJ20_04335 [Planctomycetota bacterium]|nr:hypothetical protein [Planctomycetota bacterium]
MADGSGGFRATPKLSGGVVLGFRSKICPGGCIARAGGFGELYIPEVYRPAGATIQTVNFNFRSYGLYAASDHFGVMLHAKGDHTDQSIDGYWYTGVGAAIGSLQYTVGSGKNPQVAQCYAGIEVFNLLPAHSIGLFNETCGVALSDGPRYSAAVTAKTNGRLTLRISSEDGVTLSYRELQLPIGVQSWHPEYNGASIAAAHAVHQLATDYTIYIDSVSTTWQYY